MSDHILKRLAPPSGSNLLVVGGCGGIGKCLVQAALDNNLNVAVFDLETSLAATKLPAQV